MLMSVSFLMVKQGVGIISSDRSKVGGCSGAGSVLNVSSWLFLGVHAALLHFLRVCYLDLLKLRC